MDTVTPSLDVVTQIVAALVAAGAAPAVGGSGLLAALGLVDHVRDWDVTTDAATELVEEALRATGLSYEALLAGDAPFGTRARFRVAGAGHDVEVIVGMALRTATGLVPLPSRVTGTWRGLPIADPEVWLRAYELLGRNAVSNLLAEWLAARGPAPT